MQTSGWRRVIFRTASVLLMIAFCALVSKSDESRNQLQHPHLPSENSLEPYDLRKDLSSENSKSYRISDSVPEQPPKLRIRSSRAKPLPTPQDRTSPQPVSAEAIVKDKTPDHFALTGPYHAAQAGHTVPDADANSASDSMVEVIPVAAIPIPDKVTSANDCTTMESHEHANKNGSSTREETLLHRESRPARLLFDNDFYDALKSSISFSSNWLPFATEEQEENAGYRDHEALEDFGTSTIIQAVSKSEMVTLANELSQSKTLPLTTPPESNLVPKTLIQPLPNSTRAIAKTRTNNRSIEIQVPSVQVSKDGATSISPWVKVTPIKNQNQSVRKENSPPNQMLASNRPPEEPQEISIEISEYENIAPTPIVINEDLLPLPMESSIDPIFQKRLRQNLGCRQQNCGPLFRLSNIIRQPRYDSGLGEERVMTAPLFIDPTQPMNQAGIEFSSAYDITFPDRAGYFWPKSAPLDQVAESSVNYQHFRFRQEVGGEKFSLTTDIPLEIHDPAVYPNTAGLGDMSLTTKVVIVDGKYLQLTQYTRTYMPTGSSTHRLGIGSVSMEPGVLIRYRLSDRTYLHNELKYWFPMPGDPTHSGAVLRYGLGASRVWWENDGAALIPTLELIGYSFSEGFKTIGDNPEDLRVDGENIINLCPGLRASIDAGGDLGLFELGIAGGFSISNDRFESGSFKIEMRWIY